MKAPIFMPNNSLFFHNSRIVLFYFMIAAQPPEGNSIHPIIQRLPLPCNDGSGIGKPTLHIFALSISSIKILGLAEWISVQRSFHFFLKR